MELTHMTLETIRTLKPAISASHSPGYAQAVEILGIFTPIVLNRTTQHIVTPWVVSGLKSHQGAEKIPVLVVDYPAKDEMLLSHILNGGIDGRLNSLPDADETITWLATFVEKAKYTSIEALGIDLDYLQLILDIYTYGYPQEVEPAPQPVLDWNVPELDPQLQLTADLIEAKPVMKWGSRPRSARHYANTITLFYTDDSKFQGVAANPSQLIDCQPAGAVEVNFSTYPESPAALVIGDIYKKRWLAQTWQQSGIPIMVDMNVCREFLNLNFLGVPQGWTSYANRSYQDDLDHLQDAYEAARNHAGTDDITYLIYGSIAIKDHCIKQGWHWRQHSEIVTNGQTA